MKTKWLLLWYIGAIFLFALLYALPISQNRDISWIDCIFLSSSGISVTGLSTIDISSQLSRVGQWLLLIQIQMGGIGIMVAITYLFLLIGGRFSLPQLVLMSLDQNQKGIGTIPRLMLWIVLVTMMAESIGFFLLFHSIHDLYPDTSDAIFMTAFHAVSSFTGSGFDIFGGSLVEFRENGLFLLVTASLIFLGSIGFPVLLEYLTNVRNKSLFTKVNVRVHIMLILAGFTLFFLFERTHSFGELAWLDKLSNALFLSVTARNGGLSTAEMASFTETSLLFLLLLMFIGSSSSSCGGGIRTTTFAVLCSKVWSLLQGTKDTVLCQKRVAEEAVNKSILVFFLFSFFFIFSTFLLTIVEEVPTLPLSFEVMSALTTTGLSFGMTPELSLFSKIWLSLLMLIGRVGVVLFVHSFLQEKKKHTRYMQEHLIVG